MMILQIIGDQVQIRKSRLLLSKRFGSHETLEF